MRQVGEIAVDFQLFDHELKKFKLSENSGKVVLVFYPGAFTSVCEKELCTFRDILAKFNTLPGTVVGISVDTPFANKAFAEKNRLNFRLLSDTGGEVSKQYGGVHENFVGITGYTVSKRAVYVVENGKVLYAWTTEDPRVEPPYEEIEEVLK